MQRQKNYEQQGTPDERHRDKRDRKRPRNRQRGRETEETEREETTRRTERDKDRDRKEREKAKKRKETPKQRAQEASNEGDKIPQRETEKGQGRIWEETIDIRFLTTEE